MNIILQRPINTLMMLGEARMLTHSQRCLLGEIIFSRDQIGHARTQDDYDAINKFLDKKYEIYDKLHKDDATY